MNLDGLPPLVAAKIEPAANGCWVWTGYRDHHGYGRLTHNGRSFKAHRVVYHYLADPDTPMRAAKGVHMDHACRNTSCVNPDHLTPTTSRMNVALGRRSALSLTASRYVGVVWSKNDMHWRAQTRLDGRSRYLGCSSSDEACAYLVDAAYLAISEPPVNYDLGLVDRLPNDTERSTVWERIAAWRQREGWSLVTIEQFARGEWQPKDGAA